MSCVCAPHHRASVKARNIIQQLTRQPKWAILCQLSCLLDWPSPNSCHPDLSYGPVQRDTEDIEFPSVSCKCTEMCGGNGVLAHNTKHPYVGYPHASTSVLLNQGSSCGPALRIAASPRSRKRPHRRARWPGCNQSPSPSQDRDFKIKNSPVLNVL